MLSPKTIGRRLPSDSADVRDYGVSTSLVPSVKWTIRVTVG